MNVRQTLTLEWELAVNFPHSGQMWCGGRYQVTQSGAGKASQKRTQQSSWSAVPGTWQTPASRVRSQADGRAGTPGGGFAVCSVPRVGGTCSSPPSRVSGRGRWAGLRENTCGIRRGAGPGNCRPRSPVLWDVQAPNQLCATSSASPAFLSPRLTLELA